jgi:hypothetical protein
MKLRLFGMFDVTFSVTTVWTARLDAITDDAASQVCRYMMMRDLARLRRNIAFTADGTPVDARTTWIPLLESNKTGIEFNMSRDTQAAPGTPWSLTFEIFIDGFGYRRQRQRFDAAVREFVATQGHLSTLLITFDEGDGSRVIVTVVAQIGDIVESTESFVKMV